MINHRRRKIIDEVNILIQKDVKNFNDLWPGEKEQVQDKYIQDVCLQQGFTLELFYAADGNYLNKLLS